MRLLWRTPARITRVLVPLVELAKITLSRVLGFATFVEPWADLQQRTVQCACEPADSSEEMLTRKRVLSKESHL